MTVELCDDFREYLLNANQLRRTYLKVSVNSVAGYYSTFRGLLKIAYKEKRIKENINDYLEKIDTNDVHKEFLTADDLKQLAATPCDIPVLRNASLFAYLTGLRISDILKLKWENLQVAPDLGNCVRVKSIKTGAETLLPISEEALELCGERMDNKVFEGLKRNMTVYPLKKWIADAGINKHITFHMARHREFYKHQIIS